MNWMIFLLVGFLLAALGLGIPIAKNRRVIGALERRESLDPQQLFERFYSEDNLSQERVHELWDEVASALKVPASKLRPTDRFGIDVGTYWITSDSLDQLEKIGKSRAEQEELKLDMSSLITVDDYVKAFAKKS